MNYHLEDYSTPNLVSMYGIGKLNTHLFTKTLCNSLGIKHIWCCLANTYGEGNTTSNFINMAAKKMLAKERAAFTDGLQLYDFQYIDDTVNAIKAVLEKGISNKTYYLGSGNPKQLREYIYQIRDAIDPNIELFLGEIPFNGKSLSLEDYSIDSLVNDTGYNSQTSFSSGIEKTISWLRKEI